MAITITAISTHASLAGRDDGANRRRLEPAFISTHASLAGRDPDAAVTDPEATIISTHASLAGRDKGSKAKEAAADISTHASLAGRDHAAIMLRVGRLEFQPTRPLRDATGWRKTQAGRR